VHRIEGFHPGWVMLMKVSLGAPCQAGAWEGPALKFMSLINHSFFFLWHLALMDPEET